MSTSPHAVHRTIPQRLVYLQPRHARLDGPIPPDRWADTARPLRPRPRGAWGGFLPLRRAECFRPESTLLFPPPPPPPSAAQIPHRALLNRIQFKGRNEHAHAMGLPDRGEKRRVKVSSIHILSVQTNNAMQCIMFAHAELERRDAGPDPVAGVAGDAAIAFHPPSPPTDRQHTWLRLISSTSHFALLQGYPQASSTTCTDSTWPG